MLWVLQFLLGASDHVRTPGEVAGEMPAGLLAAVLPGRLQGVRRAHFGGPPKGELLENAQHRASCAIPIRCADHFERFIKTSSSKKLAVKMTTLPR